MTPYYQDDAECACGCGSAVMRPRRYITHHNLRNLVRSPQHCASLAESLRRAWQTKRKRKPVGSTNLDTHGYVRVKVVPGSGRWDKEHALVMQESIGRKLEPCEVVHHINGNRQDNRLENLFLCRNKIEHSIIEGQAAKLLKSMIGDGVTFNKETGRYERIL